MCNGQFLVRDGEWTTVGKLQKAVRGKLLVGREINIAMWIVKVFQNVAMETLLRLDVDMSKDGEGRVDYETAMEFVKFEYVMGGFV